MQKALERLFKTLKFLYQCPIMSIHHSNPYPLFFLMTRPPPRSTPYPTLFPYTTLFRSQQKTAYEMSELQSHSEISYAVFCLKKKKKILKKRQIQKNRMTKTDEKKKK